MLVVVITILIIAICYIAAKIHTAIHTEIKYKNIFTIKNHMSEKVVGGTMISFNHLNDDEYIGHDKMYVQKRSTYVFGKFKHDEYIIAFEDDCDGEEEEDGF